MLFFQFDDISFCIPDFHCCNRAQRNVCKLIRFQYATGQLNSEVEIGVTLADTDLFLAP
jgi:hypothetical protein